MERNPVVSDYLALLDAQREAIFADLATVEDARLSTGPLRLWQWPRPEE